MGFRSGQPVSGRIFIFSESAGNNALSGTSDENPLADPYTARDKVNALDPPVTSADRATIEGAGTFSNYLMLPRFTAVMTSAASIISFADLINIESGGDQSIEIGSLLNFVANGICFKSDAKTRVSGTVNAMVVNGDDGIGFQVSGASDDSFFELTQGELRGERTTMIEHTATSPSPIHYRLNLVEMFNIDQMLIDYDPIPGSSQTVIELTTASEGLGGTTLGCVLFRVRSGILVVKSEVLSCDGIADVFGGAILTLSAQVINGDTIVQDGGICVYKSSSLLQGDLETIGSGTLQVDSANITGNATNAGSMSIVTTQFDGEIVNTGSMFVIIGNYTGTLPADDGSISGVIGDKFFGGWTSTGPFPFLDYENMNANPPYVEGRTFYDMEKKALSYYNSESDTTVNIAQETIVLVKNESGVTLSNGEAVRAVGSSGGLPLVELALADVTDNAFVAGVITHDIPDNDTGFMTAFGSVGGLDTSSFTGGDVLYLSGTTPGLLTDEEQSVLSPVALVTNSDMTGGTIFVRPRGVINLTAVGQVFKDSGSPTQGINTTPEPVSAYENVLAPGINIAATFNASEGNFEAILSPAIIGASGYYSVDFGVTCTYGDSKHVIFTVYINGSPTALGAIMPFASIDPSEGFSASINGITPVVLSDGDEVEIYVNSAESSGTLTFQSCSFNITRVGNI